MKPYVANIINALVLIVMGGWGYLGSEDPSPTALIPVAFGVIFLAVTPLFKKDNKVVAHIVVLLTVVLIAALVMPLKGALERGDSTAAMRVGIMIVSCAFAMLWYVKSFIDARKARQGA